MIADAVYAYPACSAAATICSMESIHPRLGVHMKVTLDIPSQLLELEGFLDGPDGPPQALLAVRAR